MASNSLIVVSDFDGTLALNDIGNELHKSLKSEDFVRLQNDYRAGKLKLTELQPAMWNGFPMSKETMEAQSLHWSELRDGTQEFLSLCATHKIPVFVASCGIINYIEPVLRKELSSEAFANIRAIECNKAVFNENGIAHLEAPFSTPDSPYPMDKGAWAKKMRDEHAPNALIVGIGNGTSDRSFHGCVDYLFATEGLQRWAEKEAIEHTAFESFHSLLEHPLFKGLH